MKSLEEQEKNSLKSRVERHIGKTLDSFEELSTISIKTVACGSDIYQITCVEDDDAEGGYVIKDVLKIK